jgi:hypothetical protein
MGFDAAIAHGLSFLVLFLAILGVPNARYDIRKCRVSALWERDSGWLWNLLAMVENFRIGLFRLIQAELHVLISMSDQNQKFVEEIGGYRNPVLAEDNKHSRTISKTIIEVESLAKTAETAFTDLNCVHIDHAISALRWWAGGNEKKWSDLKARSIALRNAIDNELKEHLYYQYPKAKGQKLRSLEVDWQTAVESFPSIGADAFSATDCYAMGHNTAATFHCMRVLERGLSAVAAELGLSFDVQQWQNIIEQIESKIVETRNALPRGAEKNEKMQFLSEAAKEFFYFKDGWRNYVSHNRGNYDDHQALSILEHTRSFMCHLATQLSE